MSLHLQLADQATGLVVTVRSSGNYSPDVLDDMKRRVRELWQETYAFRAAIDDREPQHIEDEVGGPA